MVPSGSSPASVARRALSQMSSVPFIFGETRGEPRSGGVVKSGRLFLSLLWKRERSWGGGCLDAHARVCGISSGWNSFRSQGFYQAVDVKLCQCPLRWTDEVRTRGLMFSVPKTSFTCSPARRVSCSRPSASELAAPPALSEACRICFAWRWGPCLL